MEQIVQLGSVVICGFLFEQTVKVMGQRELGEVIRIVSWVLFLAGLLGIGIDIATWIGERAQAVSDFFAPFRDFAERF